MFSFILLTLCSSLTFRSNSYYSTIVVVVEQFPLSFMLPNGQNVPTLQAYIATSWFAMCFTLPASLFMQLHVEEITLKYLRL